MTRNSQTSHTLHYFDSFGDYRIEIDGFSSPADESLTNPATATFLIDIAVELTTLPITSSSEPGVDRVPGRSAFFKKLFSQRLDVLLGDGSTAWDTVASMLCDVHVPAEVLRSEGSFMVDEILKCGSLIANGHPRSRSLRMVVTITAFVDDMTFEDCLIEIENVNNTVPNNNNNNNNDDDDDDDDDWDIVDYDEDEEIVMISDEDFYDGDDHDHDSEEDQERNISFDDYTIRFEPASEESIEGLEKVRIDGVSENPKEITCSVCLEDVLVGSEATRLPCSHLFHGDCIVKWLQSSKFCPLCRFELPS